MEREGEEMAMPGVAVVAATGVVEVATGVVEVVTAMEVVERVAVEKVVVEMVTEEAGMAVEATEVGEAASDHTQSPHNWADAKSLPHIL